MAIVGSKKTFTVWARHSCLQVALTKLAATEESSFVDAFAKIDDFVQFQSSIFMRMNHQVDAREWPSFDQKSFTVWALHSLIRVDPAELAATKESSCVDPLAKS
jgi:hypothetical protein